MALTLTLVHIRSTSLQPFSIFLFCLCEKQDPPPQTHSHTHPQQQNWQACCRARTQSRNADEISLWWNSGKCQKPVLIMNKTAFWCEGDGQTDTDQWKKNSPNSLKEAVCVCVCECLWVRERERMWVWDLGQREQDSCNWSNTNPPAWTQEKHDYSSMCWREETEIHIQSDFRFPSQRVLMM